MSIINTNISFTTIKQATHNYSCYCCGKTYKKRETLDRHTVLCEIIDKAKKKKPAIILIENDEIIPSQKQMYNILVELTLKYRTLEEKMEEAQKWIDKAKKKINVEEWLNKNIKPSITFYNLYENQLVVTEENIEFLFKNNFIDTFFDVLIKNMELLKITDENSPIQSFSQKANKIYVYDTVNEPNILFEELSRDKLIKFGKQVHFKIVKELIEWKNRRGISVDECEKTSQMYNNALMKLMTVDFKQETVIGKIRTGLYNNFKKSTF
jgi:hypothetical protein